MKRLFVTGTDTGVGKTAVSCALAAAFTRRGLVVSVMKPCETGEGDDANRLIAATGRPLSLAQVSPYRFPLPASPEAAASAAGARIEIAPIRAAAAALSTGADLLLVEGAGGLLVPLGDRLSMADLAATLELPVLIVARPSLGTINHTLLTLEAARSRGLRVVGVAFSRSGDALPGPDEPSNPEAIERHGQVPILGTLPHLAATDPASLAEAAEAHLDLDRLASLL